MNDVESMPMSKAQETIIEFKNVGVNYKARKSFFKTEKYQALKDVSFDVFKGETLGVIGRNGAGKSTLLRLLAGIIKADSGEVVHHTRSVSLMALAAGFDPNLSGRQNAVISGMLVGHSKKEVNTWLDDIKSFSELNDFFEKPVKSYSSGMRARLGFSIAMYTSPDVLLIDEVLGVGDASFKQKAEAAITDKINSDITVILVSHSEPQMKRLCERIIWIDQGVVKKSGLPESLFREYNLEIRFSRLNLQITYFELFQNKFLFHFEDVQVDDSFFSFNCIVINTESKLVTKTYISMEKHTYLEGPTGTPGYAKQYPNMKGAGMARFNNGKIYFDRDVQLIAIINGEHQPILNIKVTKLKASI